LTPDRSDELNAAGEGARKVLEEKHLAREITLNASRRATRACASAIRAVHRREFLAARELIAEAAAFLAEADAALVGHDDVRYGGSLHDAKKEFAEANLTLAFVAGQPMPGADELRVEVPAYLNGLAEAASELRRQVLDCLRRGELDDAERLLTVMDDAYTVLVSIDYPEALTGGLRRASDGLRSVLERTRGDVTNALVLAQMQAAIQAEPPSSDR
jgi:translin